MATKYVCDFCETPLDFEDGRFVFYEARSSIVRKKYRRLCNFCADKLNDIFEDELPAEKVEISGKFIEINKKRREKLGTKG